MLREFLKTLDQNLVWVVLALIGYGWLVSFSASIGAEKYYGEIIKQSVFVVGGLAVGVIALLHCPLSLYNRFAFLLYILALVLLALVFSPIGSEANGSRRWLDLGFSTFQPSELMKLAIVFMVSNIAAKQRLRNSGFIGIQGGFYILFITGLACLPIVLETDLGATLITGAVGLAILFFAGARKRLMVIVSTIVLIFLALFVSENPVRRARLLSYLDPTNGGSDQSLQAMIGIIRGQWLGTGIGSGIQKYRRLPEAQNDMIFAVVGEELGIFGVLLLFVLFAALIFKGYAISAVSLQNKRYFESFVAFGISFWLMAQVGINVSMNLGWFPVTGFSLPLFSTGGSGTVLTILSLAVLLRCDYENRQKSFIYSRRLGW